MTRAIFCEIPRKNVASQALGARFVQACAVEMHTDMSQKAADQEQGQFALPELCYTATVIFESIVYPQC